MIMLIVSLVLLQVWITAGSECGLAPNVTLNCTNRSAHVEWVASQPGCQYDCKAYWTCVNGTYTHKDESSDFICYNAWDFSIPWDHYFCNVTVFYKYAESWNNKQSPDTTESCSQDSIELQYDDHFEVRRPNEINCTLYTGKVVNSDNVSISWIGPNGVITNESTRMSVIPTTSDGHIHTSTLQFSYIREEDENTSYNCTASLSGEHESLSKSFTINNLIKCGLAPNVTLNCNDRATAHVEWVASKPDCQYDCRARWICMNNSTENVNIYEDESSTYTCDDAWDFSIPWDHYFCEVTVFYLYADVYNGYHVRSPDAIKYCSGNSIELQYDDHFEVGRPHEINCTLYTGKVVNSDNVSISWIGPNDVIANESTRMTVIPTTSDGHIHTSTLQFSYISEEDENTSYNCTTSLSGEHESLFKSFTMNNLSIPSPNVSVTALDEKPVIGKSFSMECNVTVAKGIIGSVDIMWIINGTVTRRVIDTIEYISSEYTLHRDVYNIAQLQLSDNNTVYYCMAVTSASKRVESNDSITLTIATNVSTKMMTPTSSSNCEGMMTSTPSSDCEDHCSIYLTTTIILFTVALIMFGFNVYFIGSYIYKRRNSNPQNKMKAELLMK